MTRPSWDDVKPLVARTNREGRTMAVVFACPVTGERVSAAATMTDDRGYVGDLASQLGSVAVYEARRELASSVSRALGGGLLSTIGWNVATAATQGAQRATVRERVFDADDEQRGVVDAFRTVQHRFRWDGARWVSARAPQEAAPPDNPWRRIAPPEAAPSSRPPNPFERGAPVAGAAAYDRSAAPSAPPPPADPRALAARMIGAILHADGQLHAEERALLLSIAPDLDVSDPAASRSPTPDELARVAPEHRTTLYQTAMAMALADRALDAREQRLLDAWRVGLGLSRTDADAAEREARVRAFQALVDGARARGALDPSARASLRNDGLRLGLALGEVLRSIEA